MVYSLVQPMPSGSPGLPRLDRQPMTWDGEMLKEAASPEVSLKPLSLGQSGGWGFFRRCWKAQEKGSHGKGPPERDPLPAQLVLRVGQGLWGSAHLGKLCPRCLVAIVNLKNNHCRVFWAWRFFYPFVYGFSVAASYLFLHFGLVVFQGFLFFCLFF